MKNCPNDRCTRLHPDDYRGSCDLCGAACNQTPRIQMSPNEHLNYLRANAGVDAKLENYGPASPEMLDISRAGVDHALFDLFPKEKS